MKKEFMEPEMKRIELNLKERIANSDSTTQLAADGFSYSVRVQEEGCRQYYVGTEILHEYGPRGDFPSSSDYVGSVGSCNHDTWLNSLSLDW